MFPIQILIFGFLFLPSTLLTAKPLKFAQIVNTPDQIVGAKILKVVYAKAGIPVEFVTVSGKRALIESSEGRLDGEIHRINEIGNIYPSLVKIPTPINHLETTAYSKEEHQKITSCSALIGKQVGRIRGAKHAEICTQGVTQVAIFPDAKYLLKSLNKDIVDYAILSKQGGATIINKLGFKSIIALTPALNKEPLFHFLHKKHKALVPQLDNIIAEMDKSGELNVIRNQYIKELLTLPSLDTST